MCIIRACVYVPARIIHECYSTLLKNEFKREMIDLPADM